MSSFTNEFLKLPLKSEGKIFVTRVLNHIKHGRADILDFVADVTKVIKIHYPSIFNCLLDLLSEDIFECMERGVFEERQHLVTMMKFFTELYLKDLFSAELFWRMVYFLINYDTQTSQLLTIEGIDHPEDTFRITLVCTILETYATKRQMHKDKDRDTIVRCHIDPTDLKRFMVIFQLYIHKKANMETLLEIQIADLYEKLTPFLKILKTKEDFATAEEIIQTCRTKGEFLNN